MEQAGDFSLKEASEYLEVSTRTIGEWCRKGRWKDFAYKVEDKWFIPGDHVRAVREERKPDIVEAEQEPSTTLPALPQEIAAALQLVAAAHEEGNQEAKALRQEVAALREELAERDRIIMQELQRRRFRWPWQK